MTKVFVSVTTSLDGYLAPPGRMEELDGPKMKEWTTQWSALQSWVFSQRFFRENLKLGPGGEEGADDQLLRSVFDRTGVTILGKRMFDAGEKFWPENAPFHTPVLVVTHQKRDPWVRPGGTTFHFVRSGIESALREARAACPPGKDVRIGGGGETIDQFLGAGLVDELHLAVAPITLGRGVRILKDLPFGTIELKPLPAPASQRVTHLRYAVRRGGSARTPDRAE